MELEPYKILSNENAAVKPILAFHFEELLKSLKRRISSKVSIRNPRTILITLHIHQSLYYAWYRAVRDSVPSFGRTVSTTKRKGKIVEERITFTHPGVFKYHIGQVLPSNIKVENYTKKTLTGSSKGNLKISEESPLVFTYNRSRGKLSVSGKYEITNRYGNICI